MNFIRHASSCPAAKYGYAMCNCHTSIPNSAYGDYTYGGPLCDCIYHNSRNYVFVYNHETKKEGFAPALATQQPTPSGIVKPCLGFKIWDNWTMPVAIPNLPQTMASEQLRYMYGLGFR